MTGLTAGSARLALIGLGVALSAVAYVDSTSRGFPPEFALSLLTFYSWVYLVAGALAWESRPGSRVGPLMMAVGLAATTLLMAGSAVVVIGVLPVLGVPLMNAFLIWVLLSFPSGRLASPAHTATVVAVGLTVGITNALVRLAGPDVLPYGAAVLGVLALWTLGLVVRRLIDATPAARHDLTPMIVAGVLVALLMTGESIANVVGINTDFGTPFRWAMLAARAAVAFALLVGILRRRIARAAVADLVVDLDVGGLGRLREALAEALGDPSLDVALWSRGAGGYVDATGEPADTTAGSRRAVVFLQRSGQPLAAIMHDPALADDPGLLGAVVAAVRLAVDNERLTAAVRQQLEEVRASRARIVAAADAGRRRVERDLHDGAQQRLVAVSLTLRRARSLLPGGAESPAAAVMAEASEQLGTALAELRDLARGIHPAILTEAGLGPALRSLARECPVPVHLTLELPDQVPDGVAACAYFVAAEALTNVAKYAAASAVQLSARVADGRLRLDVVDDGAGGADPEKGSGLRGLSDRVEAVGGRLRLHSEAGAGTRLSAELPVP